MQRLAPSAFVLLLPILAAGQTVPDQGIAVTVEKFGYQLRVPRGWHINLPVSDVPVIFNYPPEQAGPQGLFPEHGAIIYCAPDLTGLLPGASQANIERVRRGAERGHIILAVKQIPDMRSGPKFPHNVLRVESDFKVDPSDELTEREISYLFSLQGSRFRLYINYWKGERQSGYFETVLKRILESIEAN